MYKVISYIGSKQNLLEFISNVIKENHSIEKEMNFYDCFSGTTSVLNFISKNTNWNLYGSDFSKYSEVLTSLISFKPKSEHFDMICELDNCFSETGIIWNELGMGGETTSVIDKTIFDYQEYNSRMFFREDIAKKIDGIREKLIEWKNENKINKEELNFFLTFLLKYVDLYANTTSVYGAYLKYNKHKNKKYSYVSFDLIKEYQKDNKKKVIFNEGDIFDILKKIEFNENNILYLDPPYNTRKYESNYHILNYIVDLNFNSEMIKENSKTAMPKNMPLNKLGSKRTFKESFKEMLDIAITKSNHIYVSFNSEGEFTEEDMLNYVIERNLNLKTYKKEYKRYTSGEASGKNNGEKKTIDEIIWYINSI